MTTTPLARPAATDYDAYYHGYVSCVPDGDVLDLLERQLGEARTLLAGVDDAAAERAYAEGKWSLKELVVHMADAERIFTYRALAMARGDSAPLPGMDQDVYAAASDAQQRPFEAILEEHRLVRESSLALFRGLSPAAWERVGVASSCPFRVRVFPWLLAGHERHHLGVIRERYLA